MNKIDEWMKRLRDMGPKPQERVRAFDRDVVMTRTQAHRFRELQDLGFPDRPVESPAPAEKEWYTLDEACQRLGCEPRALLDAAADGILACYVATTNLRGRWEPDAGTHAIPGHLALTTRTCREIAAYGSANVAELAGKPGNTARFRLADVQWIDGQRLLFRHPLPPGGS